MKKLLMVAMLMLLAVFAVACGTDEKTSADEEKTAKELTIKHELGETKVKQNPNKVVVFDFGTLDTLKALDLSKKCCWFTETIFTEVFRCFCGE